MFFEADLTRGVGLYRLILVSEASGKGLAYCFARQLYDLQTGVSNGAWSELMNTAVEKLAIEDIVDISGYSASLEP